MSSPRLLRGRVSRVDALYLVTTVTHLRKPLFTDPARVAALIGELVRTAEEGRVEQLAWVVMPDHLHWMFRLVEGSLSRNMQRMKSRSARSINSVMGSCGPLWQAGFHDQQIRDERNLLSAALYLVANPLRGGLAQRLEDYPWWWCRWIERGSDL